MQRELGEVKMKTKNKEIEGNDENITDADEKYKAYEKARNKIYALMDDECENENIDIGLLFIVMLDTIADTVDTKKIRKLIKKVKDELQLHCDGEMNAENIKITAQHSMK